MRPRLLLAQLRDLASRVEKSGELDEDEWVALEDIQDQLAAIHEDYETEDVPLGAETQRARMLEALGQVHRGLEQFMSFLDSGEPGLLHKGIVAVEGGFELLDRLERDLLDDGGQTQTFAPLL